MHILLGEQECRAAPTALRLLYSTHDAVKHHSKWKKGFLIALPTPWVYGRSCRETLGWHGESAVV